MKKYFLSFLMGFYLQKIVSDLTVHLQNLKHLHTNTIFTNMYTCIYIIYTYILYYILHILYYIYHTHLHIYILYIHIFIKLNILLFFSSFDAIFQQYI